MKNFDVLKQLQISRLVTSMYEFNNLLYANFMHIINNIIMNIFAKN